MSIKLAVLKSGEDVIADIVELHKKGSDPDDLPEAYLFKKPFVVKFQNPSVLLTEAAERTEELKVSFFPWVPFSADESMLVAADWVVTIVEPYVQLKSSYEAKLNGNKTSVSEASGMDYLEG